MKYAMDVKVNVKPVFSNLVHSDWWEGPCRVGPQEQGTPEFERRVGREQFEVWKQELEERLHLRLFAAHHQRGDHQRGL